jgi:hypothetical protein
MNVIDHNWPYMDKLERLVNEKPPLWQNEAIETIVCILEEHDEEVVQARKFRMRIHVLWENIEKAIHNLW